jgi:hypothetical protein
MKNFCKKNKKKIFLFICFLFLIITFALYKKKYKINDSFDEKYIIENGIKFFKLDESQKIIKIKPANNSNLNTKEKKKEEYEVYKLPKYKK